MRRILYIGSFELPDKNAAALRVLGNAKVFRDAGAEVVIVGISRINVNMNILETKCEIEGFTTFSREYPQKVNEWYKYISDINPYISIINYLGGVDIIICYDFFSRSIHGLKKICKKNNMKCLADITEWYILKQRRFPYNVIRGIETSYRMRVSQKKLDGLIVISEYLYKYYSNCKNLIILPPLVDSRDKKWNNHEKKSSNILKLVYAGSPGKKDEIGIIIDAVVDSNRKITLDIIGISEEEFKTKHKRFMKYDMKKNNIFFRGKLDHITTIDYIKKANYSVFFRKTNRMTRAGFPTKFVESITCMTPVITNRTSNLYDYIGERNHTNGILVEDISKENIVKTLEKLQYRMSVDKRTFDYRKYVETVKEWLNTLLSE